MGGRLHFQSARVDEEMDDLLVTYKAVHSDVKIIVDHDIAIRQQTRYVENTTKAVMNIAVETKNGIEPTLDKLADHLERMAKAIRSRKADDNTDGVIPTYTVRKGLV